MRGARQFNAALALTAARIALIPAVMTLILLDTEQSRWWAAGVYLLAAATDSLDGWLARSRGQVTVAGAFLDPLADKLLVSAALVALLDISLMPAWAAIIIIAREFAVTGLRLVAVTEGMIIPASRWGKAKTVAQNVAILAIIAPHPWKQIDDPLLIFAVVLTVVSGAYYFQVTRRRLFARKAPSSEMKSDP